MKETTRIDAAGRIVIPKPLRERFGLESGRRVRLIPGPEGITLVPEHPGHRFIQRGPILAIDTGAETAPMEAFDPAALRKAHLDDKSHENRGR